MATAANLRKGLILGLDLGIGSCGWAVIDETKPAGRIIDMGVRTFDVPETDKERTPTNQLRREHRGLRRVIGRRRQRMNGLRQLFQDAGLIADDRKGALKIRGLDPWALRADGLERKLTGPELAVALGHIAKHRGFKSNSKRDRGANAPKDSSKMLGAIDATRERMKTYRTVGEMFAKDPAYIARKHNRDGDFTRSILRGDQEQEVRILFERQRAAGNVMATAELEARFTDAAFYQRPLADSEDKVGECPFEPGEKRAAKRCYSFELFRLLSRLAAVRIQSFSEERALTPEEIDAASKDFGAFRGMTFKRMRKRIELHEEQRFAGVPLDDEGRRDVVARTGDMASGTYALRKILGSAWRTLLAAPGTLDRIAFVLSFREDPKSIRAGLDEIGLDQVIVDAVMKGVEDGDFGQFSGAGHISAKACRKLIPHLKHGLVYSRACEEVPGYNHAAPPEADPSKIGSPVARKALTEAIKQVRAVIREHGLPEHVHIELARDVGKSKEERDEIRIGIDRRNREKDRLREHFLETVGSEATSGEDLLRFELWREQNGRCLYTDRVIHPNAIVASDNSVQIDHILPWSRAGDDSFVNKTLCLASANQQKKGRTPWEWFKAERTDAEWAAFAEGIETNKSMKGRKKRNYLLKDSSILEEKFRPRNLNDTRYACRLLADVVARMYPDDGRRHVLARPGRLTSLLRRGWGVQDLKKDADGKRVDDDRHHALDALVVAATTEGELQELTRAFQEAEKLGAHRDFKRLDPPWLGFAAEARAKLDAVFVSRAERRRARGEAHGATIRQIVETDGKHIVYERKSVDAVTESDLARIKDAERNAKLVGALREWIAAGKPKDRRPLSPKGDPIAKVRLRTNKKADVLIRSGVADRGEMVRVDVFRKKNRRNLWEYFFVPVYPHQVANAMDWPTPPNKAVQGNTPEELWPDVDETYEFRWSLYPLSFVELIKSDGEVIEGYLRGVNRNTGALAVSPHHTKQEVRDGIGGRTLKDLRKFTVDRLGRRFEIAREIRTWHGAACT
ncbi:MAG: type II CRISPR RNA-guided endonuclease Cas9 [Proteobacteria bacterium]|nr:type II CRISPR RNA-guided endonuclease Cas9 [Pseudomonadota bacterium]MBI3499911.1 type II CRISPR RNA-guided endonuclease Cas9 [Pseudomonadota bacterium]